jgi:hypothetical protein
MKNTNFSPKEFSLQKFVKNYTTCFGGLNIDSLEYSTYYKESELTKDWHFLSTKMKEKREYSCEKCGFKAQNSYQKKFLHTHHISSDKTYSNFDRLKVLCVACHSIEHNDIKKTSVYSEFIKIK